MSQFELLVETKVLLQALSFAGSVIDKRNVVSDFANVKLSAQDNHLNIITTDMELYLDQTIGVEVKSAGTVSVATAKLLTDIMRKIPDVKVTLKLNVNNMFEILGQNCYFTLPVTPVENFPVLEPIKTDSILQIPCADFLHILSATSFAMSSEETRYNLNGIYLHIKDNMLCSVATDGHRLSLSEIQLQSKQEQFGVILPRKTVEYIKSILKEPKIILLNIKIALGINKVQFMCNEMLIISKIIDGIFPEYHNLIPINNYNVLTIDANTLSSAIDRVSTVTNSKFRAVKMIFQNNNALEIIAAGDMIGGAREYLTYSDNKDNICIFEGNSDLTIGFNPKYLMDILMPIGKNTIKIHFKDAFSSVLITILETNENNKDIFIVMPIKV